MARRGRPNGLMLHRGAFETISALTRHGKSEVARLSGLSPSYISDLLARRSGATRPTADRIAAALRVPTHVLFPELDGWTSPAADRRAKRSDAGSRVRAGNSPA